VLAGEDYKLVTHHGFDYGRIQKFGIRVREAAKEAKKEGENDDWIPNLPTSSVAPQRLLSN